MLFQNEVDLILAMRSVIDKPSRDSLEYVLIFGNWLLYSNGYSILWIYDPIRFSGIAGAAHLSYLQDGSGVVAEQFFNNDAYKDLTDPVRLGLLQYKLPLQDTAPGMHYLEAWAAAVDMVDTSPCQGWLDSSWVPKILELFCPEGKVCSVHPGPSPRYLEAEAGVWFKSGVTFLGVLPVLKVDANKFKAPA
jgi:hypothetical protein